MKFQLLWRKCQTDLSIRGITGSDFLHTNVLWLVKALNSIHIRPWSVIQIIKWGLRNLPIWAYRTMIYGTGLWGPTSHSGWLCRRCLLATLDSKWPKFHADWMIISIAGRACKLAQDPFLLKRTLDWLDTDIWLVLSSTFMACFLYNRDINHLSDVN